MIEECNFSSISNFSRNFLLDIGFNFLDKLFTIFIHELYIKKV